jgi:predicted transcriptional regulator of viral defense system
VPPSTLDDKVYDYIVKHEGVISTSKASSDLGLSVNELKEITERLKKKGLLT